MGLPAIVLIEEMPTPVEDLWALWTDPEQVTQWLAGSATIEARPGGPYLLGTHLAGRALGGWIGGPITGLEEEYVLKVAWKFPPEFGTSVSQPEVSTSVTVLFQPLGPNRTRLRVEHDGWPDGVDWAKARQWQSEAWAAALARLKRGDLPR